MSKYHIFLVLLFGYSLFLLSACGDPRPNAPFDPETGKHPDSWIDSHGSHFLSDSDVCLECHGEDLRGGISAVDCFAPGADGTACHGNGAFHGDGFGDPDLHGAEAKSTPEKYKGFQSCRVCHGEDFDGGVMLLPCYTSACHDMGLPHSPGPWNGVSASRMHMDTHWENTDVCAVCHEGESPAPAPAGTPYNCFNNTLCHGNVVHDDAWKTDHAPPATSDNSSCGVANCHGADYRGGAVGVGCYDCHLGGPNPSDYIMHPNLWIDPEDRHSDYLENRGKNASSCSPSWPGIAQYCHGDGLPKDSALLLAPPNGSWPKAPTCYSCHDREWSSP